MGFVGFTGSFRCRDCSLNLRAAACLVAFNVLLRETTAVSIT